MSLKHSVDKVVAMKEEKAWQVLDGTALKLIAMICMGFDHVGDHFFPEEVWMRVIGRIAFPIFAFCIAEGFIHTHDRKKYLLRMTVFAAISEIPFDLLTAGKVLELGHQNIMLTFAWAILGLICFEKLKENKWVSYAILLAFAITSLLLGMDYNFLALGLIDIYYLLKDKKPYLKHMAAIIYHAFLRNVGIYWFGLLGFLPILLYNGKRGRGFKWLFYVFYPGHMLLLWAIGILLPG